MNEKKKENGIILNQNRTNRSENLEFSYNKGNLL